MNACSVIFRAILPANSVRTPTLVVTTVLMMMELMEVFPTTVLYSSVSSAITRLTTSCRDHFALLALLVTVKIVRI